MKRKFTIILFLALGSVWAQDDDDMDMDAMWDNTIWNEIEDVADEEIQEVDNITAVAGVRGAEAEDEALHHLYYRQSMKGPSEVELRTALGKLLNTLAALKEKDAKHAKIPEVQHYVIQIYRKLGETDNGQEFENKLLTQNPDSKWAKFYSR
ncbi:MAG TPA: hypothetical protein EYO07_05215 [Candidatus Marinimicrobia bacterium]|nr:hypothetical protein [Candidatus Neomarinimicrobiota bacterium]